MRTAKDVKRRFDALKAMREPFRLVWDEISDHISGRRDFTDAGRPKGQQRKRWIYDSTGMHSWDMLAAALHNFLTNTETDWFDFETEDPRLMERDDVLEWVGEEAKPVTKALIERPEAGFVPQMQEFYHDIVGPGTAAMFVDDVPGLPFRFSARPLGEMFVAENASGLVDTVYRKFKLSNRNAVSFFGRAAIPKTAAEMAEHPDAEHEYLHFIHPSSDVLLGGESDVSLPWRSGFLALNESEESRQILRLQGLHENRYMVARWRTESGEPYGRAPGWTALPEQKMLNAMTRTLIESAQLRARPPIQVTDDGVIHPLNLTPAGTNVVRTSTFSSDPIKLLEATGDIGLTVEMFDRRRAAVRSAFLHDLLEILQTIATPPTATQVIEMVQRARNLFAPTIGRLQREAIDPILNTAFRIAVRARAFSEPPEVLAGRNLRIAYRSPVARSQRVNDAQAVDEWIGFIANLAQLEPLLLDNVDWDELARVRHRISGAPPQALRSTREVETRREARLEMEQQQEQKEDLRSAAEAIGKAAPGLKLLKGGQAA